MTDGKPTTRTIYSVQAWSDVDGYPTLAEAPAWLPKPSERLLLIASQIGAE